MILSVENAKVTLVSVHPPFYKKRNANGHIQIWWKTDLKANKNWPFSVVLGCKNNANGPTIGALTVCSQNDTPPSKHRFHSRTFTFYHATHRCQKKYVLKKPNPRDFSNIPRPKLGSGGFSRK